MPLRSIFKGKFSESGVKNPPDGDSGGLETASTPALAWGLTPAAFRQLDHLQLSAGRSLPGYTQGLRPSFRRKPAYEFREHRSYAPGDDIRFVDWKASARQEHIFVKQGEQPKEASVYILLDCSESMRWGTPPRSRAALALAAALGYLALAHGDRLTILPALPIPTSHPSAHPGNQGIGPIVHFGPASGKGQFSAVINFLSNLHFSGRIDLQAGVQHLTQRVAQAGGLVLLISDLLEMTNLSQVLEAFPAPIWEVVVFHLLHPDELEPSVRGEVEVLDIESGKRLNYDITRRAVETYKENLTAWCSNLELVCNQKHAYYTLLRSDWALDHQVLPHLRNLQIVKPV